MSILNNNHKYGLISIIFHWGMAVIMLITFLLGKNPQDNFESELNEKKLNAINGIE